MERITPAPLCCVLMLALTAFAHFNPAATYSDPMGVIKVELTGNRTFNFFSNPFLPQAVFQSQVASVSGHNVTLVEAPSSDYAGSHFLEISSGSGEGSMSDISSVAGAVVATVDDLSSLLTDGDTIKIRQIPTIESVFGADNKFGFKAATESEFTQIDRIFIQNPVNQTTRQVFFSEVAGFYGWKDAVTYSDSGSQMLYPESGIYAYIVGPDVEVTFVGEVTPSEPKVAIFPGTNFVSVFNPLSQVDGIDSTRLITLGTAGLYTGNPETGIIPWDGVNKHDIVLLPNPSAPGTLLSFFYYAETDTWYNSVIYTESNDQVLESGTSVIILRFQTGATEFAWAQPNLHLPAP